jgi:hypothetical protein
MRAGEDPPEERLRDVFDQARRHIEARYAVGVRRGHIAKPNTGDLDGAYIEIDVDQPWGIALFVLVHLFGHTVQWNTSEHDRKVGADVSPGKTDAQLAEIHDYERTATRYGLQLLHEAGAHDLDEWICGLWSADWEYLRHYYRTGERLPFEQFRKPWAGDPMEALPVPPFTPQVWFQRSAF